MDVKTGQLKNLKGVDWKILVLQKNVKDRMDWTGSEW